MSKLTDMLAAGAPVTELASLLDGLDHDGRWALLSTLNRRQQREMWNIAQGSPPITLEHFAPANRPRLKQVVHHGRNSLPVPPPFRMFRKPMCKTAEGDDRLFGYNDGATVKLFGPGYFVAYSTAGKPEWEARGGVVVDYFQVPDGPVAEGWPAVKQNNEGLQVLIYHQTRDYMRKVSEHVSIGAAYKKEKALDHYFVLCREDPPA
ncbi:MAG: hypothetical protein H6741_25210 [Alphaproteobacteria bacterium]|nr:hypothetical protein [Alphaproteobacteria bacterium]MCB9796009.1 hypothetical protein [Alphaproteobacteria bacterium]